MDELSKEFERICHKPWTDAGHPASPFLCFCFIVLDERSTQDGTCILVATSPSITYCRAPFALANTVFIQVEYNNQPLDWTGDNVKDPRGGDVPFMSMEEWESSTAPELRVEYLDS